MMVICYLVSACPASPVAPEDGTGVECLPNEIPSGYFIGAKPIPLGSSAIFHLLALWNAKPIPLGLSVIKNYILLLLNLV